jgi:hypothetical protein
VRVRQDRQKRPLERMYSASQQQFPPFSPHVAGVIPTIIGCRFPSAGRMAILWCAFLPAVRPATDGGEDDAPCLFVFTAGDAYALSLVLLTFSRNGIAFLKEEGKPHQPRHFAVFCQSRGKNGKGRKGRPSDLCGPQSRLRTNWWQEDGSAAVEPHCTSSSPSTAETFLLAFRTPHPFCSGKRCRAEKIALIGLSASPLYDSAYHVCRHRSDFASSIAGPLSGRYRSSHASVAWIGTVHVNPQFKASHYASTASTWES